MGRRGAMNAKMVLPTVSWVAVMRLLKKAPSGMNMGFDAAAKALIGCSALPDTPSFRYIDKHLPDVGGARRPKPASGAATRRPLIGCTSRPHTDSFRVHHVVNHEALQFMLEDSQANLSDDVFYDPFEEPEEPLNCSFDMIIRDGDRLLHDELCTAGPAASASVMIACSSRLSNVTAVSSATSAYTTVPTAFSRSSVDSEEGHYSTASSASFQRTPGHPARCSCSCCTSPVYVYHSANLDQSCGASEGNMDYSADSDCVSNSEDSDSVSNSADSCDDSTLDGDSGRDQVLGTEQSGTAQDDVRAGGQLREYALHDMEASCRHGHGMDANDEQVLYHEGNAMDDDDDDGMVAETCYSADPLIDFEESIEELVLCHQLIGQPAQLHELYCRYIQLNPPTLHPTIALAFFRTVQRLSASAHHDHPIHP